MSSDAKTRFMPARLAPTRLPAVLGARPGQPMAAILSKFATALGSFVLQALAARTLGPSGLGSFALIYSVLLMIAALSNGLVGDSLTVLDRTQPLIRSAIVFWCVLTCAIAGCAGGLFLAISGGLSIGGAAVFILATAAFVIESSVRRLLQARMLFWSGVTIELTGGVLSPLCVGLWAVVAPLSLVAFVAALGLGQVGASVLGWRYLPKDERWLSLAWPPQLREVGAFGLWRAAQQAIRPALLTAVRGLVAVMASASTLGHLEAARVLMSPGLLMVQGIGTYLFASYANRRKATTAQLVRSADRALIVLGVVTLAMGVIGTAALPWLDWLMTGGKFEISGLAVFGWAVYATSAAGVTPYQNLAAVRGRQLIVTFLRCIDATISLALVGLALACGTSAVWTPYILAFGSFIGGVLVRRFALKPILTLRHSA